VIIRESHYVRVFFVVMSERDKDKDRDKEKEKEKGKGKGKDQEEAAAAARLLSDVEPAMKELILSYLLRGCYGKLSFLSLFS
jgi:hypothetical protein